MPGLAGLADEIAGFVEQEIRNTAVAVTEELRDATPEQTGLAKYSWIPSITFNDLPFDLDQGDVAPSVQRARQQAGIAEVRTWTLNQGDIFIENNVVYITDLNAGSSPQAPAGFVEVAILSGVARSAA